METATEPTHEFDWSYLPGVQNVVLIGRDETGTAVAMIELCPQLGFRLTDCRTGSVQRFVSLDEAKRAAVHPRD
jgi:hypothetical protein